MCKCIERAAGELASAIRALCAPVHSRYGAEVVCRCISTCECLPESESAEGMAIALLPFRRKEARELVRVSIDPTYRVSFCQEAHRLARLEVSPFVIGVGEIVIKNAPDGFVVFLRDLSQKDLHRDRP